MFCDEALEAIEPIATGDVTPDGRIAEHIATCPNCAQALEHARMLEGMLQRRPAPQAPAQFTSHTLGRLRRARWRSDQWLDVGFNVAVGVIVVGVVIAGWALLHRTGLTAVSNGASDLLTSGLMTFVQRVAPSVPVYAGATALVASALGIWWWAERDISL